MGKNLLSKNMYDYLTRHTNEISREQEHLFKELYAEETEECINFQEFFKEYLSGIKNYLNSARIDAEGKNSCPFVIIGSIVDVQDSDDMEEYRYRIVLPYAKQKDTSIECASCLSPLGRSLLFKSAKENVSIEIPTGKLHYLIKKITIPDTTTSAVNKLPGIFGTAAGNINM